MDEAKFPPKPYYPWLILPWNVQDDEEDNLSESEEQQSRIGIIMDDDGY